MTNEFTVVGEHREDELELLVLGADGSYYGYRPAQELFRSVEPDGNWVITQEPEWDDIGALAAEEDTHPLVAP